MTEASTVVIRTDRRAVLPRLLLLAALLGAFALFVYVAVSEKYFPWALGGVVVGWLYLVRPLLRIFVTGTAFVLTDRGLLAHIGSVDFVAWDEIDDARLGWHGAVEGIDLDLRDTEAVLARLSVLRRALLRWYIKQGGKPGVAASFGEGGAEVLLELIRRRIGPSRTGVAQSPKPRAQSPAGDTSEVEVDQSEFRTKSFAVGVRIAAVAYAVGMAIALYVYRSRNWDLGVRAFSMVGLAAVFVAFGVLPLYTGKVELEDSTYYRGKNPIKYWVSVAVIVLLGLALFLGGIGVIGPLPHLIFRGP